MLRGCDIELGTDDVPGDVVTGLTLGVTGLVPGG